MRALWVALTLIMIAGSVAAQPNPEALARKEAGNDYLKQRQYEQARDQYLAALQIDPDYADVHYNLGVVYFFRTHDYPRALYHFTRYGVLLPDAPDLVQVKALVRQAIDRIEEAEREAYGRALRAGTREAVTAFLSAHPTSSYAEDAKRTLELLGKR